MAAGGNDDRMADPGASRSTAGLRLEPFATASVASSTHPTATAVEMHAGPVMVPRQPLLPAATTVAMPAERRSSMACFMSG